MPNEIAGYADRAFIKGQYWRYAGAPKPSTFNGNIDIISEDLLIKSMFVSRSQASGTFPDDIINDYLIETIKYGNDTYLQRAYAIKAGYDGYEYKRIYSGAWSDWIGVDSNINILKKDVQTVNDTVNSCYNSINSLSGQISSVGNQASSAQQSVNSLSNTVGGLANTVSSIAGKTTLEDASNKYSVSKLDGAWNCSAILAQKFGNVVNMRIEFSVKKNVNVNAGSNAFVGTINAPNGYLPFFTSFLISCFTTSGIVAWIDGNGNFTVRVLNSAIRPGSDTVIGVGGTFIVGG